MTANTKTLTLAATKRSPGRPTIRTAEIARAICDGLSRGRSLRRILTRSGMPSYAAVCVWLREDREFQEQYTRAREAQADYLAEEIIEIADGSGDVQRDRLRIDARMWYAGKLRPKKYGAKPDDTTLNVGAQVTGGLTQSQIAELQAEKRACNERLIAMRDAQLAQANGSNGHRAG